MAIPTKPRYRKQMKSARHIYGVETRGCSLTYGEYGLRAVERGWIDHRQIEASRIAITREAKRGGKVWCRVNTDKPLTAKPAEVRMGSGKGSPDTWVAEVRKGRILFEITGVTKEVALKAMALAAAKMCVKTKFVSRSDFLI
jgi:large subunit ribosomal protein L16